MVSTYQLNVNNDKMTRSVNQNVSRSKIDPIIVSTTLQSTRKPKVQTSSCNPQGLTLSIASLITKCGNILPGIFDAKNVFLTFIL